MPHEPFADDHPQHRLRDTWLLHRRQLLQLGALYVCFSAIWFTVGWLLTRPLSDSAVVHNDQSVSEWFVPRRTPTLNSLTYLGSMMSDTVVKIVITALVAAALLIWFKRWREPLMVAVPLALEAMCFITVTTLVGRPRPDVPRLEGSPIGSSYPSGHTAAAVAYSAIVVVVFWHTRRRWVRALSVALGVIIPICVGTSRIYRGMHYLSDVVAGALLGGACVIATAIVLRHADDRHPAPDHRTHELPAELPAELPGVEIEQPAPQPVESLLR